MGPSFSNRLSLTGFSLAAVVAQMFLVFAFAQEPCNGQTPRTEAGRSQIQLHNASAGGIWSYWAAEHGDTISKRTFSQINEDVVLLQARGGSYHFVFRRNDKPFSRALYVNGNLLTDSTIKIVCSDSGVVTSSSVVEAHSRAIERFIYSIKPAIRSQLSPLSKAKFGGLDSMLNVLSVELNAVYGSAIDRQYIEERVIAPVRMFVREMDQRWLQVSDSYQHNRQIDSMLRIDSNTARMHQLVIPLRNQGLCTEAYLMIRGIAYLTSMTVPSWIKRWSTSVENKMTLALAKTVLFIVGDQCGCEVSFGLLQRTSMRTGVDFKSCSDSLPTYLVELSNRDAAFFCQRVKTDIQPICEALERTTVSSMSALDRSLSKVTRILSPDTVYLLHVWGTWCGPCLDIEDWVNEVADSVGSFGCKTIHISYESKDRLEKWQKHVSGRPGEHLVVLNVFPDRNTFVDEMAISSFPKFMEIPRIVTTKFRGKLTT